MPIFDEIHFSWEKIKVTQLAMQKIYANLELGCLMIFNGKININSFASFIAETTPKRSLKWPYPEVAGRSVANQR